MRKTGRKHHTGDLDALETPRISTAMGGRLSISGLTPDEALSAILAGREGQPIPPPPDHRKRQGPNGKKKGAGKKKA